MTDEIELAKGNLHDLLVEMLGLVEDDAPIIMLDNHMAKLAYAIKYLLHARMAKPDTEPDESYG